MRIYHLFFWAGALFAPMTNGWSLLIPLAIIVIAWLAGRAQS